MSRKQYAAGDVYERKLKRVMERLEVSEYNFNWDRHGAWIEFRLRGELYRFDHSTDKAQARGINISNNHVNNLYWGNEKSNKRDMAQNRGMNSSYLEFSEITSLESKGIEATYDISVDHKYHNFTANGFVVHNSSFNEVSLRYCIADEEYFVPDGLSEGQLKQWHEDNLRQFRAYKEWINEGGMKKEQARSLLPTGIYTQFYWTVNGRSLMNFLKLRLDKSAQAEIREYAEAILDMVKAVAPVSFTEFVPLILED